MILKNIEKNKNMPNFQFTQDYNLYGIFAKKFSDQFGEIESINPFYENYLNPGNIDTDQNELVYLIESGFDLLDTDTEGSFDMFFSDQLTDFHSVIADVVSIQPPNTYYQHTTLIHNRIVKAVRNVVNIEFAYAFGYSIRFKQDIFNVIP